MILFKVTQNTPKWKHFIFLYRCYERSGCSGFAPRWSSEAPNKENGCCSWTCDSVAAVSVCTVYETVVTELLVMRTLRVPTFARFLRGQAGLWRKMKESSKQWNCKQHQSDHTRGREVKQRSEGALTQAQDLIWEAELCGGWHCGLPRFTWHCDSKEWCTT